MEVYPDDEHMIFSDLNWGWFAFASITIGITRLLFHKRLPFKLLTFTTAATIGFAFFLVLPILGYSNLLAIPVSEYSVFIWLAYLSFLVGASVSRQWLGEFKNHSMAGDPTGGAVQVSLATVFCTVWLGFLLVEFFAKGGFENMRDVIFGGWAHIQMLVQIGELMGNNHGLSFLDLMRIFLGNVFWCLWVVLYVKMPKRALIMWGIYILTNLGGYIARSTLLGLVLVPLLAYVMLHRPSPRYMLMIGGILFILATLFFSWNSSLRLGATTNISKEQVFSDTMRDAGNSAVPATIILSQNIRGNPANYFMSMATFLIPRSIWKDKPLEQYNYEMTYQLTGLIVGNGTSVRTSTMLGESWYYFGWSGAIWLMLLFGFSAYFFEHILAGDILSLGAFIQMFYLTIIQIRSTYLTYYQRGVEAIIAALMIMMIVKVLNLALKPIASRDAPVTPALGNHDAGYIN